jgi:thiamine biosynthesis lipoprotein
MRRIAFIMGIPISIDVPEVTDDIAISAAFERLRTIDVMFSTYKQGSDVSRYQRGELARVDFSDDMQKVWHATNLFKRLTDGYFSAYYGGSYDPTGYVKSWAIQEAGSILEAAGITTYLINAAGDILGASAGKKTWNIALQDPFSRQQSLGTLTLTNGAVATSGTYERGQHITDPHTKQASTSLVSATVYGKNIITADVFATTCIAMGSEKAIDFMNAQKGYEALLIDSHGFVFATNGFTASKPKTQIAQ